MFDKICDYNKKNSKNWEFVGIFDQIAKNT